MELNIIPRIIPEAKIIGPNKKLAGIKYDSRHVKRGDLFVAVSGFKTDGHDFITEAVKRQVSAVMVERDVTLPENITKIIVPESRKALAQISSFFYDYPSNKLKLIGVTGTNGKTSTSYLAYSILKNLNLHCGIIGTVEKKLGLHHYYNENTTPESLVLQETLADMVNKRAEAVVMEVSSHALELHRVEGCKFDVAVFTNLTHDHLDFHKNMDSYFCSKAKLFQKLKELGWAVVNADDFYGEKLITMLPKNNSFFSYGLSKKARIRATSYSTNKGLQFNLVTPFGTREIDVPNLLGEYNLYNLLGAISAVLALGYKIDEIVRVVTNLEKIPGRFQQVKTGQDFSVVIDYAHTPDGVEKVLRLAREVLNGRGRVITVLGAAGERDPLKRPIMGRIAAELSDLCIITEQDSRSEDVDRIIKSIERGARGYGDIEIVMNRVDAINRALSLAQKNDMVLILGKGHEKTLYLNREINYHGDYWAVKNYLASSDSPFITS